MMTIVDICRKYYSDFPERVISRLTDIGDEIVINAVGKDGNLVYTHPIAVSKVTGEYRTFFPPKEYKKLENGKQLDLPTV